MIERLLIANRGEIARRIIRTCHRLGVDTVAVFSDADAGAAFVADADLSVGIGGNTPAESYLRIGAIIDAARRADADAVHPGYGFLAENAAFAQAVLDAGLTFVGPSPAVIAAMGSKLEAKRRMAQAGVPLLGSAELAGLTGDKLAAAGEGVGYPLLVKASAGGGGRGMRIVTGAADLAAAVEGATREATSAFGDGTVYAERYVSPSRHVEVQIFGDHHGRVIHLHERECSIQRRHQKIIEEAPSPSLDDATRAALHDAAVRAGQAIGYTNAGTVEFLLAPDGEFFFLEVNTRLQVEHPVTEAVLGLDLVELQLRVAADAHLPAQEQVAPVNGHAIEARLYAEDPTADYLPSTGTVRSIRVAGDVRVDSALDDHGEVTQFYDPMIAKVIAHAPTRIEAARALSSALAGATIDGIRTNRELLVRTLRHPEFLSGGGDTGFLERHAPAELGRPLLEGDELAVHLAAAALALQVANRRHARHDTGVASGFRNVATQPQQVQLDNGGHTVQVGYRLRRGHLVHLEVDGRRLDQPELHAATPEEVDLAVGGVRRRFRTAVHGDSVTVSTRRGSLSVTRLARFQEPDDAAGEGSLVATMPGTVVAVLVAEGDTVSEGQSLVVLEAMKMELTITAPLAGIVTSVAVAVGDAVEGGTVLAVIDDTAEDPATTTAERSRP